MSVLTFTPAILEDFSYDMGGHKFGRGTDYYISSVDFGDADQLNNDAPLPRGDGMRFGRDYRGGRTITFEGNILTNRRLPGDTDAAANALDVMQAAWDNEFLRLSPGMVVPLRMERYGRIRRVFGRPRRFAATMGSVTRGRIPFTCDFQCVDHRFYDDTESSQNISIIPPEVGGLAGPLIGPIISSAGGEGGSSVQIYGTKPSWMAFRIYGPIIDPEIEFVGQWSFKLNLSIAYDQSVLIDPSPWARSVRRVSDGANYSGAFTASSQRLSGMQLPPGEHEVLLKGNDVTGSAKVTIFWRNTYATA